MASALLNVHKRHIILQCLCTCEEPVYEKGGKQSFATNNGSFVLPRFYM